MSNAYFIFRFCALASLFCSAFGQGLPCSLPFHFRLVCLSVPFRLPFKVPWSVSLPFCFPFLLLPSSAYAQALKRNLKRKGFEVRTKETHKPAPPGTQNAWDRGVPSVFRVFGRVPSFQIACLKASRPSGASSIPSSSIPLNTQY